ncbi:hypothetical protein IV102_38170 [bacterium]|nr:hypothetical protein [bacterium]
MSTLQVEDLLKELTEEGQLQSTGRFTVDLSRAKEKLAQYQFQDPFCYILKLVQAAVAARADGFILQSGTTELVATLVGASFTPHELENLLYYLLQDAGTEVTASAALRHLAVAVNAAVGTRASEIVLKSWDGHSGVQVSWTRGGQRSAPWQPTLPQVQTRFQMRRVAGDMLSDVYQKVASRDLFSMMTGSRQGMDREQGLIYDRCAFCPIPIKINSKDCPGYDLGAPADVGLLANLVGRILGSESVNPKHHLFELYYPGQALAGPRKTFTRWAGNRTPEANYSAILALPARLTGHTLVIPVLDGVSLQVQRLEWPGPPAIFYVDAQGLDLDLTGLSLVRNEKALQRFGQYAQALIDAGQTYLSSPVAIRRGQQKDRLETALRQGRDQPVTFLG